MTSPPPPMAPTGEPDLIRLRGASEHNLKGVDLDLPRGRLIVFSGPSGSGKSTVAFDTLYAEGQRRYLESLSAYARQFLGQMEKPAYTSLKGLSPTIAIEQHTALRNPRSTVATITELADHLRVLYARLGPQKCHRCGAPFRRQSAAEISARLAQLPAGTRFLLLAPSARGVEGPATELLETLRQGGFTRVRVDGVDERLEELTALPRGPHDVDVVVDRLVADPDQRGRLSDSVELALKVGAGLLTADVVGAEALVFSERGACARCGAEIPERSPQLFSFNHPRGMCPDCTGLGVQLLPDDDALVPDPSLSPLDGAVEALGDVGRETSIYGQWLIALGQAYGFDAGRPWAELPAEARKVILHGTGERTLVVRLLTDRGATEMRAPWEGAVPMLERRLKETQSDAMRESYLRFFREQRCRSCRGTRLRPEALAVTLPLGEDLDLGRLMTLPLSELRVRFDAFTPTGGDALVARDLLREMRSRLGFLHDVGVGYLSLDRAGPSLSGGEAQRIRLASQLGSELTGILYVLDEPSIGLHPRDTGRLIETLRRLKEAGNTVLVVEHDEETLRAAEYIVDFGPGAGREGGEVLYAGDLDGLMAEARSRTGGYLSGRLHLPMPSHRRPPGKHALTVVGARANNLRGLTVRIPLGLFVCVTGVSGAGKSTLVEGILAPALANHLYRARRDVGAHEGIGGVEHLHKLIEVDPSPIGRSPRSNPATWTGAFDLIRQVFAQTREARQRGFGANRFSFNAKGGRCEVCQGQGFRRVEMHFLADVFVPCDVCDGRRFNDATLAVTFKGCSIADVLALTVDEAYTLFRAHPRLSDQLATLREVGLGYLTLGQPANTLSGGECQRLKLARELARPAEEHTLYLLDEPTTGLHFDDVGRLLVILQRLVDAGHSVLVVEHDPHVIKAADWVIDLGPEGGEGGGRVVAEGTPEVVADVEGSHTGAALRRVLGR